jgi:hypothetical protein
MAALRMLLIGALWLLLYRVARNNGCHPLLFALFAPLTFPFLWVGFATVRAQLFTLVFLAIQMLLMQSDWRGKRLWIVAWLVMFLAWLNMHAGFVVGAAMMVAHLAERCFLALREQGVVDARKPWIIRMGAWKKSTIGAMLSQTWHLWVLIPVGFALTFCNPWGTDYLPYLIRAIGMERPTITEWQPLWNTYTPDVTLLAFAVAVGLMFYAAWHRRWERLRGWLFCLLAAYMALKHIRHGSIFAVLWIGIVPALLTPTPLGQWILGMVRAQRKRAMMIGSFVTFACGVFAISYPAWMATIPRSLEDVNFCYPVGPVDYLKKRNFEGNLLTPFQTGAYVSWRLYPEVKVSLDGRYEVAYRDDVLPDHEAIYRADPDWQDRLAKYPADMILVCRKSPLCDVMLAQTRKSSDDDGTTAQLDWTIYYQDEAFVLVGKPELGLRTFDGSGREIEEVF